MRLKNIKLAGFKSFVDPTNVQLTSDMVAVVGPNGCGKSNIIDAVRWVMGESSAKTLRGESMSDVIFNGSTGRKPVGQASIELIFDNSDQTLKGEYAAFTEISIKRKVVRDGQSQYFLNGTKCRRRDIKDIFLGTGLGPRSYAIIEQGMISRMIESKPEELRVFVEEAAGISKYKERRRETELRIRHARENLERLTDIREELERQLQKLKRQANAADKYKTFKAEEREIKAQTLSLQWQKLHSDSSSEREAITSNELELEKAIAALRGVEAQIEALREEHVQKTEAFNEVQAKYYRVGGEITRIEQTLEHATQRSSQLALDLDETEKNTAESQTHLKDDLEKLEIWKAELAQIEPEYEQLSASNADSSEALKVAENAMQDWQQRWDEFNLKAAEPQKSAEVQRSRIDQIEQALKNLVERVSRLSKEREEYSDDSRAEQFRVLEESAQVVLTQVDGVDAEFSAVNQSLQSAKEARKELSERLNQSRQSLQQLKGKEASLVALQQAAKNDGRGQANQWLRSKGLEDAPRIMDLIEVDSGWEKAVETVLGDALQAVKVDKIDGLVDQLDQLDSVDISLFETSESVSHSQQPGLTALSERVSGEASRGLFGGVFAVESFSDAIAARGKLSTGESIVTKDGLWFGRDWLKVLRKKDASSGVIERQKSLDSVGHKIKQLEEEVDNAKQALTEHDEQIKNLDTEKDQILQRKLAFESRSAQAQSDIKNFNATTEQNNRRRLRIDEELKLSEQTQTSQRTALTESRELLDVAIASMQEVEDSREALLLERDKYRDALSESKEKADTDREALQSVAVRSEGLRAQIDSVQSAVERLESQIQQLSQRSDSLQVSKTEVESPIQGLQTELENELNARVNLEKHMSEARAALEACDRSMRETETRRNEGEELNQKIRGQLEQARIDIQEMAVRTKTIEEQLEEEGHSLQTVIDTMPEEANLSVWQEKLSEISTRIERLGAINLAAIDEFETESERKQHLDSQNTELESALATLEDAIQKIDKETRGLFKDTFDKLNESLQDLFPKVFGGGAASLEMTGEDLLDTGISIMAQPPGKKNSTIHLLSGGEKALTAIALVFSIFQLNPAPFCMLDEVDAPLDDANTGRYARLINEMSSKVQFIFITHNKITMEMADHLMGVTMHEPGCSRLVSVDINEAVELATA